MVQAMKHIVALNKSSESLFHHKMATSLLVSVSVFSIMVSYSSLLPVLLNSIKFSFSAYKNIDKNYVFLLCNGIVVLIFKNCGGFTRNSPQEDKVFSRKVIRKRDNGREVVKLSQMDESILEKKVVQETQESALVPVVAEEKQEQENEFQDEEDNGLSREELNKKCEEFIRKMKEVIKCQH